MRAMLCRPNGRLYGVWQLEQPATLRLPTVKIPGRNLLSGSKYDLDDQHQRYTDEKRDEVDNVDSEILVLPDLRNQIGGPNVQEVTCCERDKK